MTSNSALGASIVEDDAVEAISIEGASGANVAGVAADQKHKLLGLSPSELEGVITAAGLPKFRAKQLWRWVWRHGLTNFDEMSDLGKTVRAQFADMFTLDRPAVTQRC